MFPWLPHHSVCCAPAVARASTERLNFPANFFLRKITLSFLDLWNELQNTWLAGYCRWEFEGKDQTCEINHFVIAFPGWAFVILLVAAWTRFWTNQCWLHLLAAVLLFTEILMIWRVEKKCFRVKKREVMGTLWTRIENLNGRREQLETFVYFRDVKCLKYLHSENIVKNERIPSVPTVGLIIKKKKG